MSSYEHVVFQLFFQQTGLSPVSSKDRAVSSKAVVAADDEPGALAGDDEPGMAAGPSSLRGRPADDEPGRPRSEEGPALLLPESSSANPTTGQREEVVDPALLHKICSSSNPTTGQHKKLETAAKAETRAEEVPLPLRTIVLQKTGKNREKRPVPSRDGAKDGGLIPVSERGTTPPKIGPLAGSPNREKRPAPPTAAPDSTLWLPVAWEKHASETTKIVVGQAVQIEAMCKVGSSSAVVRQHEDELPTYET